MSKKKLILMDIDFILIFSFNPNLDGCQKRREAIQLDRLRLSVRFNPNLDGCQKRRSQKKTKRKPRIKFQS